MAAKTKAALTCNDISCNIIRNLNLVHIIRTHTGSLPSCRKDIVSQEKHYVCKNLYFNRKYSTEHDNARRYRYLAMWARNRFLTYDRLKYYCKRGSLHSHITPRLVFYAIGICLLRCRPVNRLYILTAAEGR